MSEFKTPGVYVQEIPKFPPSVAQVETAVPSFIGYTQQAVENGQTLYLVPKKISSLVEYETYFGKAKKESIQLQDTQEKGLTLVKPNVEFLMYYSLQMYFANGGGPCYIISVGDYTGGVSKATLKLGLDKSALQEESTLVVFPDAVSLPDETQFYALYQDALIQANSLKNRFVILDTYLGDSTTKREFDEDTELNAIEFLRQVIGNDMHAAAYFPHLKTVLNYSFDEKTAIAHAGLQNEDSPTPFFSSAKQKLADLKVLAGIELGETTPELEVLVGLLNQAIAEIETVNITADVSINLTSTLSYLEDLMGGLTDGSDLETIIGALETALNSTEDMDGDAEGKTLEQLKLSNSTLYNQIIKEIESLKVVLPPSSTIAGVYARVDGTKGVWKSPANVGLNYVVAPTEKISDKEQESLNIDQDGKSINAIRYFTGKGPIVWGARTFDGNSNEWKYVSVRRLFDMVEKSVLNATEKFLFEPNDASTWVRAKAMIENYLNQLWMSGALAGSTPEQAYYVSIGLNETMSAQDILEGRMNIEIGMAAVRPAEFIVLNFSHKLQQA